MTGEISTITEERSNKIRMLLFAVATIILFLIWGMRVYAENLSVTMTQGETKVIECGVDTSPGNFEGPYIRIKPKEGIIPDGIRVEATRTRGNYIIEIAITTDKNVEPGQYELQNWLNGWSDSFVGTITILAAPEADSSNEANNTKTGSTKSEAKEAPPYIPLTPEEIYLNTLSDWYPMGYRIMKTGDSECFNFISNDGLTSSFWQAGVHIGDFSFVTADDTARKMLLQDPKVVDGVSYPSVWVNVNDGEEVTLKLSDEHRKALLDLGITGIYLNEKLILL